MNFFDNKLVGGRYRDLERCFGRSKHIQKLLVLGGFGPEQISYSGCAKKKRICLTQQGFFFCKKFRNLYTVIPPQTGQIWSLFLYTYGVKWVMPDSIRSLLESGRVNRQEKGQRRYGRLFLYEISKRCFEDHRLHIPMLKIYATTICNFSKYTTWFSF